MSELKPCPFCGSIDITISCCALDYPTCNVMAYVHCNKCEAEISAKGNVKESNSLMGDVVKRWNNRGTENKSTTPSEAAERVQKLVEALEAIERTGTGTMDGVVVLTQEAKLARQALAGWRRQT